MRKSAGFTLIEAIVAIAIFGIILAGVLGLFSLISQSVKAAREQTILAALSAAKLEVMRNLPYAEVGTVSGNPNGALPDFTSPESMVYENHNYEVYYEVTYIDDPADGTILAGTDPAANDYKQVKMYVKNLETQKITSFVTNVSPKGLEGTINAGALVLRVIDASGQPVTDATLSIINNDITPAINLSRQTDATGTWIEVGLPESVNGYQITASKTGYSSDSTYPITVENPNPIKPHATVAVGAVTQVSFGIDAVAQLNIATLNATCGPMSGVDVRVIGSKLVGVSPDVLKYDVEHTSSSGSINLSDVEWDVYLPALVAGQGLTLYGTSPIQQVNVLPGASQNFTLILGPNSNNSLLVIVKDASTGAPIEGATVTLSRNSPAFSEEKFTGGSVWNQASWNGGAGQDMIGAPNRYLSDDGNIEADASGVSLAFVGSNYVPSGSLTSSTFDTGGSSNYTTLEWEPTSQNPATQLRFQVASNNDNATWNFVGPDGTAGSFYTVSGSSLSAVHNGQQYIRYRAYLSTSNSAFTPTLTNMNLNYVSGCNTPGQVVYTDLAAGSDYSLSATMAGYQNYSVSGLNITGNQTLEVLMSP